MELPREYRSYSQHGEDTYLLQLFGGKSDGVCVEVGAHDGMTFSNTYLFEELGWRCILVEPNPELCRSIKRVRNALVFQCAASNSEGWATLHFTDERSLYATVDGSQPLLQRIDEDASRIQKQTVPLRTLDDILKQCNIDVVDFVSVDVEGHELEVLEGFSVGYWRPKVLIIEDNSFFADERIPLHLRTLGYQRFKRTGCNDWYASMRDPDLTNLRNSTAVKLLALKHLLLRTLPAPVSDRLRRFRKWCRWRRTTVSF